MKLKDDLRNTYLKLLGICQTTNIQYEKLIKTFSKLYEINFLVRKAHDKP